MKDASANDFGLPPCLLVPTAAATVEDIETYVGPVVSTVLARNGRINAVCVVPSVPPVEKTPGVKLWQQAGAALFVARLHPPKQVWVHVDYAGYRGAYVRFGMPAIPTDHFLDHVQNRESIRLRGRTHPYLRLCPVSRLVNTNAGVASGGEGLEKDYLRSLAGQSDEVRAKALKSRTYRIIYADPMDLTKMLDIAPGTQILNGVRDMLDMFYPA